MRIDLKYINTTERPCPYHEDERPSSLDYYAYDEIPSNFFESELPDKFRKTRFDLVRKGLLGEFVGAIAHNCPSCNECVPLRINTFVFSQTNRHRKILDAYSAANGEAHWLETSDPNVKAVVQGSSQFFTLYQKFLTARFPSTSMLNDLPESLAADIMSRNKLLLLTRDNKLLGFTQVDRAKHEAILDYIVYDPDESSLFLGTVSFLETVKWAHENLIPYVYIGTTNDTTSMRYKRYYPGLETYDGEKWVPYKSKVHTHGPDNDKTIQELNC